MNPSIRRRQRRTTSVTARSQRGRDPNEKIWIGEVIRRPAQRGPRRLTTLRIGITLFS